MHDHIMRIRSSGTLTTSSCSLMTANATNLDAQGPYECMRVGERNLRANDLAKIINMDCHELSKGQEALAISARAPLGFTHKPPPLQALLDRIGEAFYRIFPSKPFLSEVILGVCLRYVEGFRDQNSRKTWEEKTN